MGRTDGDACVIHEQIDGTEAVAHFLNHSIDLFFTRNICPDDHAFSTNGIHLR